MTEIDHREPGKPGPNSSWRRYAAEGALIVVSILLALLLDAGWDYLQEREREARYIDGLASEFGRAQEDLKTDQDTRRIIERTCEQFLVEQRDDMVLGDVLFDLINYRFYAPPHPVLRDLISSGNFRILRSERLRRALLVYEQARDNMTVVEQRERDFISERVEEALITIAPLGKLLSERGADIEGEERQRVLAGLRSQEAQNVLFLRCRKTNSSLRFGDWLEETIGRVQKELQALQGVKV